MTTLTDDDVLRIANSIDKKYGEIWDFTDSEMVKFARAILDAHEAKRIEALRELECPPDPDAVPDYEAKQAGDAARWRHYRAKAGPDAPNPFWCLRVYEGEVDRLADKARGKA